MRRPFPHAYSRSTPHLMADKKIEKALYGPSLTEVALGAVLGLLVGFLAACVYLVFKPVIPVKELPKETALGAVYYIPGSELGGKAKGWEEKQKHFLTGGNVSLSEDELNAWSAATLVAAKPAPAAPAKAPAKPAPKEGEAKPDAPVYNGIFNPGPPNFRVVNGKLQIASKCVLNWYGAATEVVVLTTGQIMRLGDDIVFLPETFYLGSCPMHLIPGAMPWLESQILGKLPVSDDLKSAWAKLKGATLDGGTVNLTMR